MIAAPNDTALATRLQLFCGTLDTSDVIVDAFSRPMTDRPTGRVHSALEARPLTRVQGRAFSSSELYNFAIEAHFRRN